MRSPLAAVVGVLTVVVAVAAQEAWADADTPALTLSGFGTLGAVYHGAAGVTFRRDISQGDGAEGHHLSFTPDSMLGIQVTAHLSPWLDASAQAVGRNDTDGTYMPELTWAYLKFMPTGDVSARVGRLGIEMYMQGDSAEIGYANLPVRQPVIFYPRDFDGVDVETTRLLGQGTLRLKASAGWTEGKIVTGPDPYDTKGSRIWGALAEYSRGAWTGRVSCGRLTLKNQLAGALDQVLMSSLASLPNGRAIVDTVSMKDRRIDNASMALAYDSGPVQGMASYSLVTSPHWSPRRIFFSNVGYRLGRMTPYIGFSVKRSNRDLLPSGVPEGLSPATDALNQASAVAQASVKINESDLALGVRYDFARNMALKLQVDRIRYQDPESIVDPSLANGAVEGRGYKAFNLFSVTMDFVF